MTGNNRTQPVSVPVDYTRWETYTTTACGECGETVTYANTKIVSVPVSHEGPIYPGMMTAVERRVCAHH